MRCSRFACALFALSTVVVWVNRYPAVSAVGAQDSPDTLQQRVSVLEEQVHQLRQLVDVLQAERLGDVLPVQPSAIIGEWVAKTERHQTITLDFYSNGTFGIAVRGESVGSIHGTGTWKLNKMQVACSYRYDGENALETLLPLDLISKDAMAFAGVVYRRSAPGNSTSSPQAK